MKILLGLTTTPGSDWKEKIKEVEKLKLEEVSLFLTGLNEEKRKILYGLLETSSLKAIPHVHLRDDMRKEELKYLEKRFSVKAFNIHGKKDPHPFLDFDKCCSEYNQKTFLENTEHIPEKEELIKFGGMCIDFSHWKDGLLLNWDSYKNQGMEEIIKNFPVGCSHVSAVGDKVGKEYDLDNPKIKYQNYSKHRFDSLNEFDYMKNFAKFAPELISLELENSFEEQLKAKDYLEKIIYETK